MPIAFANCRIFSAPHDIEPVPSGDAPLLYFGRLSLEKGVDDLLHAMQRLPDLHLVIAGDGPHKRDLRTSGGGT